MDQTRDFYDDLSHDYHLIYEDWWRSVERQGEVLSRMIEEALGPGSKRVLDCTAGVGTQALGLSRLGYDVMGTDLSDAAIARARQEAESRGLDVEFRVCDVREIGALAEEPFDVVLSADNSLPHLLDRGDLASAVEGMLSLVGDPGLVLVTLRDYDELVRSRPQVDGPRVLGEPGARRMVLQLWDWEPSDPIYHVSHLIISERGGSWTTSARTCRCRAITRSELTESFRLAGASNLRWIRPTESGFFQPILLVGNGIPV